jgi:hypothetical protein
VGPAILIRAQRLPKSPLGLLLHRFAAAREERTLLILANHAMAWASIGGV